MKQWSGKDFARLLERHGWRLLRVHGSHHIYGRPEARPACLSQFTEIVR